MALIKCPECSQNISDECKKCPQCGYMLKNETNNNSNKINELMNSVVDVFKNNKSHSIVKNKIKLSNLQILSLICLICSLFLNISERCFTRSVYPQGQYVPSQVVLYNFEYLLTKFSLLWRIMEISMIFSIISIFLFGSKWNKLKKKKLIYIPNVIYGMTIIATIVLVLSGKLEETYPNSHAQYSVLWGAIYVAILSIISVVLLMINKKRRSEVNEEKSTI